MDASLLHVSDFALQLNTAQSRRANQSVGLRAVHKM